MQNSRKSSLKLSIILPVYNEERHIRACLEAIDSLDEPPYEIILVDNNCTDQTIEIARKFKNVRIVSEKTQGLIAARNRGFKEATGDILCRIDADAALKSDWTRCVRQALEADSSLAGVTGLALTRVLPRIHVMRTTFYTRGYFWWTWYLFRAQVLWGANMAVRRSAWKEVIGDISYDDKEVHEDQDLSLCLLARGGNIKLDSKMLIFTNGQTYNYAPKLISYIKRAVHTRHRASRAGRFPLPKAVQLPWWQVVLSTIAIYTLGVMFLLVSIIMWPLDQLMIALGREGSWLD